MGWPRSIWALGGGGRTLLCSSLWVGRIGDSVFVRLISHQPAVLFSQNKPATSNQPPVLFSQNKSAPAIGHRPNRRLGIGNGGVFDESVLESLWTGLMPIGPEPMLSVAGPNDVRTKWAYHFFPTNTYSFKFYLSKKSVISF
jgi:hypothetical protein